MASILIVEDSPTQGEALRMILDGAGFEVVVATNANQALANLESTRPDLIVSDVLMPEQSGYEFCRHLKDDPRLRDIPVVFLTSLSNPMDIIMGLEVGAENFITKPYAPDYLISRIHAVLHNRAIRSEGRVAMGIEITFLGRVFTITADRQQIIDLLIHTFEETIRTNQELQARRAELATAKALVEDYAHRLEGQVQTTEEKYRVLTENAYDAFFILGPDGMVQDANRSAEGLLGRSRAELIGAPFISFAVEANSTMVATGTGAASRELPLLKADGTTCWVDLSMSPVSVGAEPVVLAIARDISRRKVAEHQLQQIQKMEAIGTLTGGLAHDFNNLLAIVIGNLDLVEDSTGLNADIRKLVDDATAAALRGAELVRHLLAFSRQQPLQPKRIDANERVEAMMKLLRRLLDEDVQTQFIAGRDLWTVEIDPVQLESALANLAANARDAMPSGGRFVVETRNVPLCADYAAANIDVVAGDYVLIEVSDTGTGIPADVLARVVEPFFTTKAVGKGTGLGLSMVYGFVRQSGGHLKIYSELGHGTTVRLYLPRASDPEADQIKGPDTAHESRHRIAGKTILVVDDNAEVRAMVVRQLTQLGLVILEANDGREALDIIDRGEAIDLLFTDMVMPGGMNGVALAGAARERTPNLKVLFTSGFPVAMMNGESFGGDNLLLSKPYRQQDLAQKLHEIFGT